MLDATVFAALGDLRITCRAAGNPDYQSQGADRGRTLKKGEERQGANVSDYRFIHRHLVKFSLSGLCEECGKRK